MRSYALALVVMCACSFERGAGGVDPDIDAPVNVVVDAPPDAPMAGCPVAYARMHGEHAYKLTDQNLSWTAARAFCAEDGGHLVKIETADEDAFIADMVDATQHAFVWIGLHDPEQTNTLVWSDNAPLAGFDHFGLGQPDGAADKDCVDKSAIDVDGRWFTFRCTFEERAVCECDG